MKKQILAAAMAMVLLGAGTALAGAHYRGAGPCGGFQARRQGPDSSWLDKAPQNIQDALKQIDIKHSEIRLEISKGNIDAKKLGTLHGEILKKRRTIADYCFEQALKSPTQARDNQYGWRHGFGPAGGGMNGSLFFELRNELRKDNPDAVKAKQLYTEMMNLSEKHAKERFDLALKYPDSLSHRYRGHF